MFNLSALLLDDAFKPATPLTNGVISEMLRQFAHSDNKCLGEFFRNAAPETKSAIYDFLVAFTVDC